MLEHLITILYFFATFFMLGFAFFHIPKVKLPGDLFERIIIRLAAGIALFPLLILILQYIKIPLDWLVILVLSGLVFVFHQIDHWLLKGNYKKIDFSKSHADKFIFKRKHVYHILACIFAFGLFVLMHKGAFGYLYLEDDDPWHHAMGAKYISEFKTYSVDNELDLHVNGVSSYLWPYPPFYTSMMGVLHQLNDSVNWTVKFFNALLIGLGAIFFYIFTGRLLKSHKHAMIATGIYVVLPCGMSHFIWAQTLAIVAFFPAIYCLHLVYESKDKKELKSEDKKHKKYVSNFDWKWFILSIIIIGSALMIQPWATGIFGFFLGFYWVARVISERSLFKSKFVFVAIFLGCVVSFLFWAPSTIIGVGGEKYHGLDAGLQQEFFQDDSGMGIVYGLNDFLFAPKMSKMDQATGIGVFVVGLVILAFVTFLINIKKLNRDLWFWVFLIWFLFCLYNFLALYTDWFRLTPHRMWAFFSIPLAVIAAKGLVSFKGLADRAKPLTWIFVLIVVFGIILTSAYPKYYVQTSAWPPGMLFRSQFDIQGVGWLTTLPSGTKILNICDPEKDRVMVGMDHYAEKWDVELYDLRKEIMNRSVSNIIGLSKGKGYNYLVIDSACVIDYGVNETNRLINSFQGRAEMAYQNQGYFVLKA